MALTDEEIHDILNNRPKRGRPLQRDKWGAEILSVLQRYSDGLEPRELQIQAGLDSHQIGAGVKHMRDNSHDGPPVMYVPSEHRWYATANWERGRAGIREVFLQRMATLGLSAEKLAAQFEDEDLAPETQRMVRRFVRDIDRMREDAEDLVADLT